MRRALCWLSELFYPFVWWHVPEVVETYDECTRKLRCTSCGKYFAMSDKYQAVLPWDPEYEQIVCMIYGISRTKL